MFSKIAKLRREESGQDLIEYALLAGFVAVIAGSIPFQIFVPSVIHMHQLVVDTLARYGGS